MEQFSEWIGAAEAGRDQLIGLRRDIHSEPELGLDCPRTRDKLQAALGDLPLTVRRSERTSGFVAVLGGARQGRTVLLRGDMDALPIHEATGLEFASREPGKMHACGHDSHSAMLASAARILCSKRDQLAGRIRKTLCPMPHSLCTSGRLCRMARSPAELARCWLQPTR
jgi:hippurate hydrolase